jgi:predicted nucleic acid-binding protein
VSGFLLDTNVVSELRKGPRAHAGVRHWISLQRPGRNLYLSVLTVGELRGGVELLRFRDPEQAVHLDTWVRGLVNGFDSRILPVSLAIAERWGHLASHQPIPDLDRLLAATAIEHALTIATRNLRDFERTGVPLMNPWGE